MDQLENIARTYSQAPWRKQLQIIALFLLGLVIIALIAGIYLSISARATAVGRDIQRMQDEITELDRVNEDLQSELARILSSSHMEARARTLGFIETPADQIVYLKVPEYVERQAIILAPSADRNVIRAISMPPEYTESLFEWLYRQARDWIASISEEKP